MLIVVFLFDSGTIAYIILNFGEKVGMVFNFFKRSDTDLKHQIFSNDLIFIWES